MNVKLEPAKMTFKISEAELNALMQQETITISAKISDIDFSVSIVPAPLQADMQVKFICTSQPQIILSVPLADIQKLSDIGRNRSGLMHELNGTTLVLQVDVRGDTRRSSSSNQAA